MLGSATKSGYRFLRSCRLIAVAVFLRVCGWETCDSVCRVAGGLIHCNHSDYAYGNRNKAIYIKIRH